MIKIIFFTAFFVFILIWVGFSWIIAYHLIRFGYEESPAKKMLLIFIIFAIFIICFTIIFSLYGNWDFENLNNIFKGNGI
ncbi:MAG: hypothetical protein ABH837_03310 [bacterium]